VRGRAQLRAAITTIAADRGPNPSYDAKAPDQVIVQRFVRARAMLAVAAHPDGIDAQVHDPAADPFGAGTDPRWVGSLGRWPDPCATRAHELVRRARDALTPTRHGLDVELVVDHEDTVHVVQARPLTAALFPDAAALLQLAHAHDPSLDLSGRWVLDAEHNPAPLSIAHAWLMGWLAEHRPAAGRPTPVAGWLYVRRLPRDLAQPSADAPAPVEVLHELRERRLPAARVRLREVDAQLARGELDLAFVAALEAFGAMIDAYLHHLVPARAAWRASAPAIPATAPDAPLSLRERGAYADVLPVAWDLASPTLAELGLGDPETGAGAALPEDPAEAATLLAEWDDHLFALGLAPLRHLILAKARDLGISDADAFMVAPPRLLAARGRAELRAAIEEGRRHLAAASALRPPLWIEDGRPVAAAAYGRLRGHPIGEPCHGILTIRRDLAALIDTPPAADEVVAMPALTAPAAVVLHRHGVRAVCCEHGGPLGHAALMARELGLSALVGCRGCTEIAEGTPVHLDTRTGRLRIVSAKLR
jgi:phosphohistidine swiveling domain-containing protein